MNSVRGWKIFTVAGVPVYLNISLIFLIFYITLIASFQFHFVVQASGVDQKNIVGTPSMWGLVFAVSFFVSLLLHEFGHAIAARTLGMKVRGVTLFMLGGVSEMDKLPDTSYSEFAVSIIGPLVSLLIAECLFYSQHSARSANIILFSYWLSRANFGLAIFNLLPAFPTDGGRILRSILAARKGRLKATQIAVRISNVFAWTFGILALLQFNFLLLLIAFFIYAAAKGELTSLTVQKLLQGIPASELTTIIDPISESETLAHAAYLMLQQKSLILPVSTSGNGLAVVTAQRMKSIPKKRWPITQVQAAMAPVFNGIEINEDLSKSSELRLISSIGGVPVTKMGQVVGILRYSDLMDFIEFRSLKIDVVEENKLAA